MDTVRKTFKYVEDDIEKELSIEAKITMKTLLLVKEELEEEGEVIKIQSIFENISNLNAKVIASLILNSIQYCSDEDKQKVILLLNFEEAMGLLGKIIDKSMPKNESQQNEESMFEDDEEDVKDWDFLYMDYVWNYVLKRQDDFYNVTPKYYFQMIEHHKTFNEIKDNTEKVEYI